MAPSTLPQGIKLPAPWWRPSLPLVAFAGRSSGQARGINSLAGRRIQGLGGRIPEHPGPLASVDTAKGQGYCPILLKQIEGRRARKESFAGKIRN